MSFIKWTIWVLIVWITKHLMIRSCISCMNFVLFKENTVILASREMRGGGVREYHFKSYRFVLSK